MDETAILVLDETVKAINAFLVDMLKKRRYQERDYPWIVFLLEGTEYAINTRYVMRVAILYEIVPFVDAPAYCPGVIWDHSGMIRLFDLRGHLGQGNYLSAIKNKKGAFPMIIVIGLDGRRRGIIIDKIISIRLTSSAHIINPKSFRAVEFEDSDAKIDWNDRVDIGLMLEAGMAERSGIWQSKF